MAAWSVRAPYITALKHSWPIESMISLSATASIYTLPSIHLPTWRPRNSFQWSSVTGQSNNSSSRIPLDCHYLGDLCRILVVLFSTICHQISQWLHVLNWTENSILWFLILNLSLIFILLFVNYQNRDIFFEIYRRKGAADNLIFIGHHASSPFKMCPIFFQSSWNCWFNWILVSIRFILFSSIVGEKYFQLHIYTLQKPTLYPGPLLTCTK